SKSVDLVNGNPVSTASSPRDETLGHFLTSSGVISEEQHRAAVQRAAASGGKLGDALVAMQVLSVEQLIEQLGKQARHKLVQALRWPQGAWRFEEYTAPVEGMQLRMIDVVLGGLKETAVEDLGRLARLDGMTFELTERGKRLKHELKKAFGERALAVLAAGGPIGDIEKALGDRVQARTALDSMLMCDAIVTKTTQVGLGAAPLARIKLRPATVQPPIELEADEPPTPEGEEGEELFALLFDDEKTRDGQKPLDFEDSSSVVVAGSHEDSGVVSMEDVQSANLSTDKAIA